MDVKQNEVLIVLDRGMEPEEVAAEAACCKGKPSTSAATSVDR